MEDLLACRACLATDAKLFNMYKYDLVSPYEMVTGIQMTSSDSLPQQLCSFCLVHLQKSALFQQRCRNAQELLHYAILQGHLLTTDYVHNIDRETHNLIQPYTSIVYNDLINISRIVKQEQSDESDNNITDINNVDDDIEKSPKLDDRLDGIDNINTVKLEQDNFDSNSDEIPLSNMMKKSKKRKRKCKNSIDLENMKIKDENNIEDIGDVPMEFDNFDNLIDDDNFDKGSDIEMIVLTKEQQIEEVLCRKNSLNYKNSVFNSPIDSKSTSHLTHIRLQHPSSHACDVCGESFLGDNGLRLHKKKAHKDDSGENKETKCMMCGTSFRNSPALERHVAGQNGTCNPDLRPCVHCGESFVSVELLEDHARCHQKDKTVKCIECDRVFAHARSFSIHHQRVHLGVKSVQRRKITPSHSDSAVCELCGKSFISRATLVYHQRTHTGEKPYQCNECPKRFSMYQRLQIHIRTHTGERPFKCSQCPKGFKHKAALNRHIRVHTGVKPYVCVHCNKAFSQSNSLKTHIATVHLKRPAPYRKSGRKIDYLE
ncbi:zinc finger protein 782-like [Hyposmocoma kahamanoa]|uniref:zinc finger protein 782-like n=1 Tax=Hyposmocoma kahamanoa TaxID=1477025 RepID=UPI000E6D9AC3|nr:zinc finger protein 782-like [Hyposmocoma kahamanoa]